MRTGILTPVLCVGLALLTLASPEAWQNAPSTPPPQGPRFKGGVDIVNISVTVTDERGRLVTGLSKDDFVVYEDNVPVTVTHFGINPISLGIVVDTSGSMEGDRMRSARNALERFLSELQDPENEFFLYEFNSQPKLVQGWTRDRRVITKAISRLEAEGGTAMYDGVAAGVRLAATGKNARKAVLVVSDGNDDGSGKMAEAAVVQLVRENEVAVYTIGIDNPNDSPPQRRPPESDSPVSAVPDAASAARSAPASRRLPAAAAAVDPKEIPEAQPPAPAWPPPPSAPQSTPARLVTEAANVRLLRSLTDDTGGRTEVVRSTRDIEPATTNIARELSQRSYLGYPASPERDGRTHLIRVEVVKGRYTVRARRSYIAS